MVITLSDKIAREGRKLSYIGHAIYLARVEAGTVKGNKEFIKCTYCPYMSKSFHESSLHARYHIFKESK